MREKERKIRDHDSLADWGEREQDRRSKSMLKANESVISAKRAEHTK